MTLANTKFGRTINDQVQILIDLKWELLDICGQLGDIEGEHQKTAEEAIRRIQELIE